MSQSKLRKAAAKMPLQEPLARITDAQKLVVREMQIASVSAMNAIHEFRQKAEAELKRLQADFNEKDQVLIAHLTKLAREASLDIDKVIFDFSRLGYVSKL
jgi:Ni2+-binding GTPase involved in maturation of urease and hydrogenase